MAPMTTSPTTAYWYRATSAVSRSRLPPTAAPNPNTKPVCAMADTAPNTSALKRGMREAPAATKMSPRMPGRKRFTSSSHGPFTRMRV
ncbi:hypothetical protein ACLEPN_29880 [Myxococcus sp. 1LA]